MYFVYILKSTTKAYSYVGVTRGIEKRLKEHNNGLNKSSAPWRPFVLIHNESYPTLAEARKRERFFKCTPQGGKLKRKILAMAGVAVPKGI